MEPKQKSNLCIVQITKITTQVRHYSIAGLKCYITELCNNTFAVEYIIGNCVYLIKSLVTMLL